MKSLKVKYGPVEAVNSKDGYLPSVTIPASAIPELKDKKVGDVCTILVKAKITSMNDSTSSGMNIGLDLLEGEYEEEEEEAAEGE